MDASEAAETVVALAVIIVLVIRTALLMMLVMLVTITVMMTMTMQRRRWHASSQPSWIIALTALSISETDVTISRKVFLARRGFYLSSDVDSVRDTLMGETDLDRDIGGKLNRAQLERAFSELPVAQRRTLEMFYFEGLELREIATILDDPLGNIRHHYYRGLERLRQSAFVEAIR